MKKYIINVNGFIEMWGENEENTLAAFNKTFPMTYPEDFFITIEEVKIESTDNRPNPILVNPHTFNT